MKRNRLIKRIKKKRNKNRNMKNNIRKGRKKGWVEDEGGEGAIGKVR